MSNLVKTLNKFNGNICFTDANKYIFECDRVSGLLSYDTSSKSIVDICMDFHSAFNYSSYLVAFSDNWLGSFANGVLVENYFDTGISNVDRIIKDNQGNWYILNKTANQLTKYGYWTLDLPDYSYRNNGNIALRESDRCVVYNNDLSIYVIRDNSSSATILNSLSISGDGSIKTLLSNQISQSYSYMRARTVDGKELEYSSSSSSESSSSQSSSSSSSTWLMTSSSSSSSSTFDKSTSSSSSSLSTSSVSSSSSSTYNMTSSSSSSSSVLYWDVTARDISRQWGSIASSDDGTKLIAVINGTSELLVYPCYTSTDSGVTWIPRGIGTYILYGFGCVASSGDGTKLVAGAGQAGTPFDGDYIYTSADSGVTWNRRADIHYWASVASSNDGSRLVACNKGDFNNHNFVWTSSDYGVSWSPRGSERSWSCVASSDNGANLVAGTTSEGLAGDGWIYVSSDYGMTWTPTATDLQRNWISVASSNDGSKLVAIDRGYSGFVGFGMVYTSNDYGVTWTMVTGLDTGYFKVVACSGDGMKISVTEGNNGYIYQSDDRGVSWNRIYNRPGQWLGIASSDDGRHLAATEYEGQIYTLVGRT